ncbi:2312_t:CDS:1 [Ambispora gerdemannii]|uniref:2312_t:CDS:1 n=1 Tax=Ambispora gerdemannii TaxID=144530 RepID=A0A9N8WMZ0_9GLOM|nr:2312_t:CDS:1 [Ambispora gerdemannii]
MHIKAPEQMSIKIFDIPGLPQIEDNAIQHTLNAFEMDFLTGDKATDDIINSFLSKRQVLQKLLVKSVTISKRSANLAKKIVNFIEASSSTGLENKMCNALINSAKRITNDTRELAEEYSNLLLKLNNITKDVNKQDQTNKFQKTTLQTESRQLDESIKKWTFAQKAANYVCGIAALAGVPLAIAGAPITIAIAGVAGVAGMTTFAIKKGKEKEANSKTVEIDQIEFKSEIIEVVICKIDISLGNVKQFENLWRHLADDAKLKQEDIETEIDSIKEFDDKKIINEVNAEDLKLKWEEVYDIFESYANNIQEKLDLQNNLDSTGTDRFVNCALE